MRKIIVILCLTLLPLGASAWWAQGHMIVAALAFLELDKPTQEQVTDLLKHHPEYERSWKSEYRKYKKKMELGAFLMMRASVWADEIKRKSHPSNSESHSNWHYVTYKVKFPNNHEVDVDKALTTPNVVWAIKESQKQMFDQNLDKAQRAISLSWLIHLIGDIHQPLHCGSEFNDDYPNGDLGGNLQYVRPKRKAMKLHGLWDSALGKKSHHRKALKQAMVMKNTKGGPFFQSDYDPVAWSKESFDLILTKVHDGGKFPTSKEKGNAPKVSKEYLSMMKGLASQQGTKGGVRLATAIKGFKL